MSKFIFAGDRSAAICIDYIVSLAVETDGKVRIGLLDGSCLFHDCKDEEGAYRWQYGIVERIEKGG